jgi:hypothetical protein
MGNFFFILSPKNLKIFARVRIYSIQIEMFIKKKIQN